jgi:hypothetical protein
MLRFVGNYLIGNGGSNTVNWYIAGRDGAHKSGKQLPKTAVSVRKRAADDAVTP